MIPLALALIPVRRGLSVTIKDAIIDLNVKVQKVKKDKISKLLEHKMSNISIYSIRSAMENRRRFGMNVAMLTLSGLMFVGITGSILSINTALSKSMDAQIYDYQILTSLYTEEETLVNAVAKQDNISRCEIWGTTLGQIIYDGGNTGNTYGFSALSANTKLYRPNLMEGRWFTENDTNAIVVSFEFL